MLENPLTALLGVLITILKSVSNKCMIWTLELKYPECNHVDGTINWKMFTSNECVKTYEYQHIYRLLTMRVWVILLCRKNEQADWIAQHRRFPKRRRFTILQIASLFRILINYSFTQINIRFRLFTILVAKTSTDSSHKESPTIAVKKKEQGVHIINGQSIFVATDKQCFKPLLFSNATVLCSNLSFE